MDELIIECCDVQTRRFSSSLPACSIVTGPECGTVPCSIAFFNIASLTLSGILFDGSNGTPTTSELGIILYEFDDLTVARERRLSITDCIFRNFDGGVFSISEGPFQARALNIVGFTRADPNESLDIQIVRSGFFDNESGGVLLLVLNVDDGSTGNVNANVRDCQFERNGNAFDFFRLNDYSGIAVIGNVASVVVESSRFIDNLSAALGAAIKIDSFFSGLPFDRRESVRLRENIFRGNRCGPGNEVASTIAQLLSRIRISSTTRLYSFPVHFFCPQPCRRPVRGGRIW